MLAGTRVRRYLGAVGAHGFRWFWKVLALLGAVAGVTVVGAVTGLVAIDPLAVVAVALLIFLLMAAVGSYRAWDAADRRATDYQSRHDAMQRQIEEARASVTVTGPSIANLQGAQNVTLSNNVLQQGMGWDYSPPSTFIAERRFHREMVPLDGFRYDKCTFIDSKLVFAGTRTFEVIAPTFVGDCSVSVTSDFASGFNGLMQAMQQCDALEFERRRQQIGSGDSGPEQPS